MNKHIVIINLTAVYKHAILLINRVYDYLILFLSCCSAFKDFTEPGL